MGRRGLWVFLLAVQLPKDVEDQQESQKVDEAHRAVSLLVVRTRRCGSAPYGAKRVGIAQPAAGWVSPRRSSHEPYTMPLL